MMTHQLPSVRAAIAINNVGCSLLERSCYDQAHQTLKDAAQAMVMLLGDDGDETRRSVASKLCDADQRLAFPCDASPFILQDGGKCPAPLRLDVEALDLDESPDLIVMSAITVHNSAVSCFYQSIDLSHSPEKRRSLQSKAMVLLQSSYTLIQGGSAFTPSTLIHALHILENLSRIMRLSTSSSIQEGQGPVESAEPESFGLDDELTQLRAMVQTLESAHANIFGRPVFAAAA
jgi:hypothetical protein